MLKVETSSFTCQHYGALFEYFDYRGRQLMSCHVINNALDNETEIPTQEAVETVLSIANCLVQVSVRDNT